MGNFEVLISLITAFLSVVGIVIIEFSKDNLVRLLAHLSESTYIRKVSRFFLPEDWMIKTSNEEVKTFINGLIENEKIKESQISKLEEKCNYLLKLIEGHNRGCVGLFHKKIKL